MPARPPTMSDTAAAPVTSRAETAVQLTLSRRADGTFTVQAGDPRLAEVLGCTPQELRDDASVFFARLDPADLRAVTAAVEASARDLSTFHLRCRFQHPERGWRWIEAWTQPEREADRVITWRGFIMDVTSQVELEEEVRAKDAELRETFEQAPVGMTVSSLDGRVLRANAAMGRLLGKPASEVVGRSILDLTYPDDREATAGAREVLLAGTARSLQLEKRFLRGDGADVWTQVDVSLVRDPEGRPLHFVSQVQDISDRKRLQASEAALRVSVERLRQIGEAAEDWIWEFDADGLFTYASPAVEQLLGYRPDELEGRLHFYDLWPDDYRRERLAPVLADLLAHKAYRRSVNARQHRNGRRVQVETTAFPIVGPSGELLGYRGTDRDLTEREVTRAELQRSRERFAKAFEANPIAMAIASLRTREFVDVNRSWIELTACPRERIIGKTLDATGIVTDAATRDAFLRMLRDGESVRGQPACFVLPDGRTLDLLISGGVVEIDGEACAITSAQDVTGLRRAEAALRDSEARFRDFFQHSPVAVWEEDFAGVAVRFAELRAAGVTDLRGYLHAHPDEVKAMAARVRILDVNAASLKLMGVTSAGELMRDLPRYFTADSMAVLLEELCALFDGQTLFEAEIPHLDARGRRLDLQVRVSVMPGHEATLDRVLASFTDLTGRKSAEAERLRMETELNHLQRLDSLGRLAGGVSHDMNNVLSAIMAVASMLKDRAQDDPEAVEDAETLIQAAIRGRDLVKGLRDFSRKELESATQLDLNELVHDEAVLLERTMLKRVAIVLDLEPDLRLVWGEASSIKNALMNLCINSVDAMKHMGTLRLLTRNVGEGYVELEVQDDGEGMPPEVAARALEPFFTTKPPGKGTGLGLSQVYGMVKAHGGTLDIQSEPGVGTRVSLTFPRYVGSQPVEAPGALEPAVKPLRILLVDDEEMVRSSVVGLLKLLGHDAQVATSGLEALRRLEAGLAVDLVMLDVNMPGMDGVETLSRLRLLRPGLPVLFATGFVDDRMPGILKRFPAVRLVRKPFSPNELARALAET